MIPFFTEKGWRRKLTFDSNHNTWEEVIYLFIDIVDNKEK